MKNDIDDRKNLQKISRYMCFILRHQPEAIGIQLDPHGWARVDELIEGIARTNVFNREMLEDIVRSDSKQRYAFNEDKTLIRANQGHSVSVDVEMERKTPPEFLYHGTGEKYVASINEKGLLHKSRLYVHLSEDETTALEVGRRHGNPVVYKVYAKEMADKGGIVYRAANGVWLTFAVPPEYLELKGKHL